MITLLGYLQLLISRLVALIIWPVQGAHPIWTLLLTSISTCLLILWLFHKFSNQAAIGAARRQIQGNLLGVRLFRNDLNTVMRLQHVILKNLWSYLKNSLIPLPLIATCLLFTLTQLPPYLSTRPLQIGEAATVTVTLAPHTEKWETLRLESPKGMRVEGRVMIPALREITWRIRAEAPVKDFLSFRLGQDLTRKEIRAGNQDGAVSRIRTSHLVQLLLNPGEPPLSPSGEIEEIRVAYPNRHIALFGLGIGWPWIFLVFSGVFTLSLRSALGVEI